MNPIPETDRKWIAWLIIVALIVVSTLTGIRFPIPPYPGQDVEALGVTHFTQLDITAPTSQPTGIPALVIDSAGGLGRVLALFTIADGEIWFVHAVFIKVTTNFECTGDDCVAVIGDGTDTDGFCIFADAELQTADTEYTGAPAGWEGLVAATMGVFLDGAVSSAPHIYAPSGAAETVDVVLSAAGNDFSTGQATAYIIYTRIQ